MFRWETKKLAKTDHGVVNSEVGGDDDSARG